jgi:hypothetical protein
MEVPRREPGNQKNCEAAVSLSKHPKLANCGGCHLFPHAPFPTRAPFSFPGSRLGTHRTRGSASVFRPSLKIMEVPGRQPGNQTNWQTWRCPAN